PMQVKLLRAIQEKRVRPIGSQREQAVDVRIISATHMDLAERVETGQFRQDLFYRINVIELKIPPLRERREDIVQLAERMLSRIAAQNGLPPPLLRQDARDRLIAYDYPGNVRELENILERAVTLCEGERIGAADILLPQRATDPPECQPEQQLETYLERVEREAITQALEATHWNRTAAAKKLGISFRQLRYRLAKLGIE
ncbi:MAG: sigma-54-dependent Fis family transcriptional regulator, partial [Gammaproteobacteria bacterium]|nr:sigma-54-dependent Fis family transcriptional regulator [Gammaproteobacteria bacterium]